MSLPQDLESGNETRRARPLRIESPGAWYHVTARGNERKTVFREDGDRRHFLDLLEESVRRHRLQVHSDALMDNHYHLLVGTPEANLSESMRWRGVSYSTWFNRRHHRIGHLFQGRFNGIVLEPSRALSLSRYVHLNPVRIKRFRLDKADRKRARSGVGEFADKELIRERLAYLRGYRWSSYGAYAGSTRAPKWLSIDGVLGMIGGKTVAEQKTAYRQYVEREVREGLESNPWEGLVGQILLGSEEFVEGIKEHFKGDAREQKELRALETRWTWEDVVRAVEQVKKEKWEDFSDRHGDWGRDLALYLARREAGMKLGDLGQRVGGVDYGGVAIAVYRMGRKLAEDPSLAKLHERVRRSLDKK